MYVRTFIKCLIYYIPQYTYLDSRSTKPGQFNVRCYMFKVKTPRLISSNDLSPTSNEADRRAQYSLGGPL